MAEALIRGLVRGNPRRGPRRVVAFGTTPRAARGAAPRTYGIDVTTDNRVVAQRCNLVVLSVKPQIIDKVLREIGDKARTGYAGDLDRPRGVDAATSRIGGRRWRARRARGWPNTPALVGRGVRRPCSPGTHGERSGSRNRQGAVRCGRHHHGPRGEPPRRGHRPLRARVPAYIFLILEALADAGVKVGLAPPASRKRLAAQTRDGARPRCCSIPTSIRAS